MKRREALKLMAVTPLVGVLPKSEPILTDHWSSMIICCDCGRGAGRGGGVMCMSKVSDPTHWDIVYCDEHDGVELP